MKHLSHDAAFLCRQRFPRVSILFYDQSKQVKTPWPMPSPGAYAWSVKTHLTSPALQNIRLLKKRVRELRALLLLANDILRDLILNPIAKFAQRLCSRFYILQKHFVKKYHEARKCAIAAFGYGDAFLSLPLLV